MWFVFTISLTVAIFMSLLRNLFPPRVQDYKLEPGTTPKSLARKYRKWEAAYVIAFLLLSCICTAIAYYSLELISGYHAASLGDAEFILTPGWQVWLFPAMFLGMCLAGFCLEPFVVRVLGDRQPEYDAYQELRYGRIARMRSRHAFFIFFLPFLLLAFVLLDTYYVFGQNEMVFNWFAGVREERFAYTDVERILSAPATIAPVGSTHVEWRFVVYFRNGERWNCVSDPSEMGESGHKRLAAFVSQKSGVPIQEIAVLQREDQ